jgi:peroxisome-assembly ATPase
LKDYEPSAKYDYSHNEIRRLIEEKDGQRATGPGLVFRSWFPIPKAQRETMALVRVVTDQEAAMQLDSPKGLLLHGEVGTGKSMLVDLFAGCLPHRKKRRWHFNAFMLEVLAKLEDLRRTQPNVSFDIGNIGLRHDYSLFRLATDMIQDSPILFLDEFQLPDRASSKIMTNLMTGFFRLGGVLIATSNRMPEELAKASGVNFAATSTVKHLNRKDNEARPTQSERISGLAEQSESDEFLALLKARCDIWEMEGTKDYRRLSSGYHVAARDNNNYDSNSCATRAIKSFATEASATTALPKRYLIKPVERESSGADEKWVETLQSIALGECHLEEAAPADIQWRPMSFQVYGRKIHVPLHCSGISCWTFSELCAQRLGPAAYITLASTFHTLILYDVPILTLNEKDQARRFITLLDALYEARCKLLISAAVGPDDIFAFESSNGSDAEVEDMTEHDALYPETFSEAYQDATSPFRPNVASYSSTSREVQDYEMLADDALEDDPPNRPHTTHSKLETPKAFRPNFTMSRALTGEDERFAYKRARSRLWELCSERWWNRSEEGWWKPIPKEVRRWEGLSRGVDLKTQVGKIEEGSIIDSRGESSLGHGSSSPFRTHTEPPPRISWAHIWGTVKWGKRAGPWGQGPEGLVDRKKN